MRDHSLRARQLCVLLCQAIKQQGYAGGSRLHKACGVQHRSGMGSYISIENNTEDSYLVKVGPDEAALKISAIVTTVIGVLGTIVATLGSAAPLAVSLVGSGVVEVLGLSTSTLAYLTSLAASVSGISYAATLVGWSQSLVYFITKTLIDDQGFVEIKPGETRAFGKFTLSLWRQATCVRVRTNPSNLEEVVMDKVYMRPIFSGPTVGSTIVHGIGYWIDKFGHEERLTVGTKLDSSSNAKLAPHLTTDEASLSNVDEVVVAEKALEKAKRAKLVEAGLVPEEYEPGAPSGGVLARA